MKKAAKTAPESSEPGADILAFIADLKAMGEVINAKLFILPNERKRPHHMGVRSLLFLLETLNAMREHGGLIAAGFDREDFEWGVAHAEALHELLQQLDILHRDAQAVFLAVTTRYLHKGRIVRDYIKAGVRQSYEAQNFASKFKSRKPRGAANDLARQLDRQKVVARRAPYMKSTAGDGPRVPRSPFRNAGNAPKARTPPDATAGLPPQ